MLAPTASSVMAGKDLVENWLLRALKLFRRCKLIESEVEMQFKLIEYLRELYHATGKIDHFMRVVESIRVVHD
jgi:hypothetical protein